MTRKADPAGSAVRSAGVPTPDAGRDGADVVYVLPDKQGGVASVVDMLLRNIDRRRARHGAILVDHANHGDTRLGAIPSADWQSVVRHDLPCENLRTVVKRLYRAVPPGPGVLVANDFLELAMLAYHDPGRAVVQIVHGDYEYYYGLAERHEGSIDAFVACSERICETLRRRLPHRAEDVHHLPYGVPLPEARTERVEGEPLRVCFVGRLDEGKGVFDLPKIDRRLAERGVGIRWSVVGDGPAREELERRSIGTRLRLFGSLTPAEVQRVYRESDVLVLPTRAEGFPVVLLEAMAAGLVPVVSDLPSGVPELVTPGATGFRPAVGDVEGFASAVTRLATNRAELHAMSRNARNLVAERHDVKQRAAAYADLFDRLQHSPRRPRVGPTPKLGSRLDRPWIPNWAVVAVRRLRDRPAAPAGTRTSDGEVRRSL